MKLIFNSQRIHEISVEFLINLKLIFSVYIDAADACTTLSFNIKENSVVKPKWLISVTQYTSDFNNKAPKGCLQYFFGADKGIITGLNWNSSSGKSMDRNKRVCIRREANRSSMEYHQAGGTEIAKGNKGTNFEKCTFFSSKALAVACTNTRTRS